MPLLNQNQFVATETQRIANRLLNFPSMQFHSLLTSWDNSIRQLWGNPENTQAILDIIGTNAAELFELSAATATFLETLQPGCTANSLALLQPFTVNPDGTITINT